MEKIKVKKVTKRLSLHDVESNQNDITPKQFGKLWEYCEFLASYTNEIKYIKTTFECDEGSYFLNLFNTKVEIERNYITHNNPYLKDSEVFNYIKAYYLHCKRCERG